MLKQTDGAEMALAESSDFNLRQTRDKDFLIGQLRGVYSKIFPSPRGNSREGIERRNELCRRLKAYEQFPAGPEYDDERAASLGEVNTVLTGYFAETGWGVGSQLELSSCQFNALKTAFTKGDFAALQGIQSGEEPRTPVRGVLTVGAYEMQLLCNALLGHRNSHAAHVILHEMKKCTLRNDLQGVRDQLQLAYDNDALVDVEARIHSGIKLDVGEDILLQIYMMFRAPEFQSLEPYEGLGPCFLEAEDGSGLVEFLCY